MVDMSIWVDEDDNVIGSKPNNQFKNSPYITRSSHLYLFNSKGEVLLQKRSVQKSLWPGLYDISVSGTNQVGETYEQALVREVKEEIGIDLEVFEEMYSYTFRSNIHNANKKAFRAVHEGPFTIDKSEVDSIQWYNLEELRQLVEKFPEKFCPPFPNALKMYFEKFPI
ncbi:MAG: NUDIX domain-containing protein [bacterium]